MAARICSMEASVERERSVSSMRRTNTPLWWRAKAQLKSAVRAPPTWKDPVGLGAKRTLTVSGMGVHCNVQARPGAASREPRRVVALELHLAHDGARQRADHQHDPPPGGRGVDHRAAAVHGTEHRRGHG